MFILDVKKDLQMALWVKVADPWSRQLQIVCVDVLFLDTVYRPPSWQRFVWHTCSVSLISFFVRNNYHGYKWQPGDFDNFGTVRCYDFQSTKKRVTFMCERGKRLYINMWAVCVVLAC